MVTLAVEEPYAAVVNADLITRVCSNCFKKGTMNRCARCQIIRYCSVECQELDWTIHKVECDWMRRHFADLLVGRMVSEIVRLIARMIIRKGRGDEENVIAFNGRTVKDLQHHWELIEKDEDRMWFVECVAAYLLLYMGSHPLRPNMTTIYTYYGKVAMNSIVINDSDEAPLGLGLYLGLSAHDHSCVPDVFTYFVGRNVFLRSPRWDLQYSTRLTVPYTALDDLPSVIRKKLDSSFYFTCSCSACSDPQREAYMLSIKCSWCASGVCPIFLRQENITCTNCGKTSNRTLEEALEANDALAKFYDNSDEKDLWVRLSSRIDQYEISSQILSRLNLGLAKLAYAIVNLAIQMERWNIVGKYVLRYHKTFKYYLPLGYPFLTTSLIKASIGLAIVNSQHPRLQRLIFETREAISASHGSPCVVFDVVAYLFSARGNSFVSLDELVVQVAPFLLP